MSAAAFNLHAKINQRTDKLAMREKEKLSEKLIWTSIGWIVSIVIAVNGFFIKRLIDQMDSTDAKVSGNNGEILVLQSQQLDLKENIKELRNELRKRRDK